MSRAQKGRQDLLAQFPQALTERIASWKPSLFNFFSTAPIPHRLSAILSLQFRGALPLWDLGTEILLQGLDDLAHLADMTIRLS